MSSIKFIAPALLCLAPMAANAECANEAKVQVDEASMTIAPKEVRVCQGGRVEWTSDGPSRFHVIFPGPRPGNETRGDPTYVVVEATNAKGNYPYVVKIKGQELDPLVIIE
jgi:plastocyanin